MIKQAFLHVDIIGPHVAEGHYDLIGPNGEIILPQVWETMIEPDWSITMHMWPMPEPPRGPPAPPPGPPFERPRSRHEHGRTRPPGAPPPANGNRGPPGPPPPWPPGGGPPPPRPGGGGPGGPPVIVSVAPSAPKTSRKKAEPAKGVLGWMAGKPAKSSGKGMMSSSDSQYYINTNRSQVQKNLNKMRLVTSCDYLPPFCTSPTYLKVDKTKSPTRDFSRPDKKKSEIDSAAIPITITRGCENA